ncbi:MAG: ribonuclease P protein component [Desulfovibrionales bacterium]|nr:ribonuclease P protein component [Desulfovibrionales bacterium]
MSTLTFPSFYRLTRRPQFCRCYERGRRFFSANFVLFVFVHEHQNTAWRLGLAVSKKIGNAVARNRTKRLIREFFRLHQHHISLSADIVVVPKRGLNVRNLHLSQVQEELTVLLQKISTLASCL